MKLHCPTALVASTHCNRTHFSPNLLAHKVSGRPVISILDRTHTAVQHIHFSALNTIKFPLTIRLILPSSAQNRYIHQEQNGIILENCVCFCGQNNMHLCIVYHPYCISRYLALEKNEDIMSVLLSQFLLVLSVSLVTGQKTKQEKNLLIRKIITFHNKKVIT